MLYFDRGFARCHCQAWDEDWRHPYGCADDNLPHARGSGNYGPAITQTQTLGSIASNLALACALWGLRVPLSWAPLVATLAVLGTWFVAIAIIYMADMPAELMTAIIIANAFFIVFLSRDYRSIVTHPKGTLTDGAVPIAIFLIFFFLVAHLVPEFLRGVFVTTPIGPLAAIHFARRVLIKEDFKRFTIYTQGATGLGATFVIILHFTVFYLPIALSMAAALVASLSALMVVAGIWSVPKANR